MKAKSKILTDREKAVVETIRMRLNTAQSLAYMKEVGFQISERTLRRDKAKVESMKLKRLYHIAQIGFQDQHIDRIDNTEICLKLMWENYNKEQDPYKRVQILKDIILVQPYLSSYYETTKLIFDQRQLQNEKQGYDSAVMTNDYDDDDDSSNAKF
jgi:hypothetical protein